MSVQIRRGLDSDRTTTTFAEGELIYTTDLKTLWVGDGTTAGGIPIGGGTVSSVGLSVPTGFSVSGSPVTTSGTLALSFASGYSLPTTASQTNWNSAYSWGNHASAGYYVGTNSTIRALLSSSATGLTYNNTTGVFTLTSGYVIPTSTQQTNWNTAYGWGNHASAGYLLASTAASTYEPIISLGTTSQYWRGDKTWQDLGSAVRSSLLTGLNITGGTIVATDSVLQAFGKIQNQINGVVNGVTYQGTWNASTNSPSLSSGVGTKGHYYVVSVAGSTSIDGISDWKLGDWIIFNGTTWDKVDNTDAVTAVNGAVGSVSLTGTTNRITVTGTIWDIAPTYTGQTSITTLGTITSGTWNGNSIGDSYISSASNWNTAYTNRITSLTTTGNSGAATLSSNVLNIPQYTLTGLGGQPLNTNLTSLSSLSYTSASFVKMTAAGTFNLDTTTYYPSSNPNGYTSNLGTVTSVSAGSGMSFSTITNSGSIAIDSTKVPFINAGFSNGFLTWNGSTWVFDNNTYLTANQSISLSGDVTGTGSTSITATIASQAVTYSKIQNVAANSFLANITASPASVQEVSINRIPLFSSSITGTPSASTYLRGDGSWATVTTSASPGGVDKSIQFNQAGVFSGGADLTWDYANSRLGIGTDTPTASLTIHSQGTGNVRSVLGEHWDNTTAFSQFKFIGSRARGSKGSPSAVLNNDSLVSFNGRGYKTTGWSDTVGGFYIYAAENWTNTATGTYLTIRGVATGSTTVQEWVRINQTGITASSYIVNSGTSTQFLKADGSLDSNTYLIGNQAITLSGDVTGSGTVSIITAIANNAVTDAKFRQSGALSVVGRSANSLGNVGDISSTADFQILRRSGTSLGFGSIDLSQSGAVGTSRLAFANLTQGSARSILGVSGNSSANFASIQGTTDQVLRIDSAGTGLGFGQIATGGITDSAVTYSKIQNVSAASRLLGRGSSAGSGVVEEIVLGSGLSLSGNTLSASGGGGGGPAPTIKIAQTPDNGTYGLLSGAVNGTNTVFTVPEAVYVSGTLQVYRNGQLLTQGASNDFQETNATIGTFTFLTAPLTGDVITAVYQLATTTYNIITSGTAAPTGGNDGDIYLQYT